MEEIVSVNYPIVFNYVYSLNKTNKLGSNNTGSYTWYGMEAIASYTNSYLQANVPSNNRLDGFWWIAIGS